MTLNAASARLLDACRPRLAHLHRPLHVALTGLPGSGKSTLAGAVVARAQAEGWPALALSLDDFYLPRRARAQLARHIHPLLATRGVPGTHDLALLQHVLERLEHASTQHPLAIPRFDKGRDTRRPPSRWPRVTVPPRLIIVEGWCLGIRPQGSAALLRPINDLEREADHDRYWRTWVNTRLPAYLPLWTGADLRVALRVPNWPAVCRHRQRAEDAARQRHALRAMDHAQLARFLQHYERLGRHALRQPPAGTELSLTSANLFINQVD